MAGSLYNMHRQKFKNPILPLSVRYPTEAANNCFRGPRRLVALSASYFSTLRNVWLAYTFLGLPSDGYGLPEVISEEMS